MCSDNFPYTEHIVYAAAPRTSDLLQHWTIHHIAVTSLNLMKMGKNCPKHIELIQRSIKLLLLRIVGHLYYSPILRRTELDIKMYISLQLKYRLFLSDFNETCNLWTDFLQATKHQT